MINELAALGGITLVIILVLIIIFSPLMGIWTLNTLFGIGIAYNIWTWLAMLWLQFIISNKTQLTQKLK